MNASAETKTSGLNAGVTRVVVLSRCAWTMYNFRRHLIRSLVAKGIDTIAAGAGGDGYEAKVESLGISFVSVPLSARHANPLEELRLFLAFYRLLRKNRPQVVHAFTIKPVIFGTLAAGAARVPVRVVTITGLGHVFTSSGFALRMLTMGLYRVALHFAHCVYFQNTVDRDIFLEHKLVSPGKVRMIAGSGVDTEAFLPQVINKVAPGLTFVMVARVLREKGVCEFFEAAKRVRAIYSEVRIVLVGGVDLRNPTSLTEEQTRHSADKSGVTWIGQVDDVRPYLAEADVVVLPSYREGTPMSLLEAAAMAKPIVTTDVPGCTEVVQHGINGYLVKARDSQSLAEGMLECIRHPERLRDMGMAGRRMVESKFDANRISSQMLGDYNQIWSSGH